MADIYTLTAPLLVQYPNGEQRLIADKFAHSSGMVYAVPYWLDGEMPAAYLLPGEIRGEGPWKIGDVIVRLLSCADVEHKMQWAEWEQYLYSCGEECPYNDPSVKQSIINKMSFVD